MLAKGMYLADRYEIIEQIGSGGMSDVYKAQCHKLNRLVAIKVLKKEFSQDATFVKKFRVEAQSAAGLTHPNIVGVYDVGEENGIHYIVMELVQGITLKNYIEMKGHLDVKEALNISVQIANGLSIAHENRIIHRDIKPQNIMISRDGKVKVADFGIAKMADSTTVTTNAAGSVHYISPEQARGGYSDAKSDIYSLGITMYEMLTGKVPFDGETNVAVALLHIQGEMIPPRQLNPEIPRSFEKIILKCTQKKPERRYSSAKELIADLKKVLTNPDGEYVILPGMMSNETTVVMSEDDLATVNAAAATGNASRQTEFLGDLSEEPDDEGEGEDEDNEDDEEVSPALEKVVKVLGIVGGIILFAIILFIIGKAVGLFGGGDETDTTDAYETTLSTESEEESETEPVVTEVPVPDLSGKSREAAKAALESEGLVMKAVEQSSDTIDAGYVIDQNPAAGKTAAKGDTVTVYISTGKETFTLDDLSGKTKEQAETKLSVAGLTVGGVDYEYSDTFDEGRIIRTSPAAGSTVAKGDKVSLVISQGAESNLAKMPGVIGKSEADAIAAIVNAGLTHGATNYIEGNYNDYVASANLADGSQVQEGKALEQGTPIYITVSQKATTAAAVTYSYSVTPSTDDFGGASSGTVRVILQQNGETKADVSETVNAGTKKTFTLTGVKGAGVVEVIFIPAGGTDSTNVKTENVTLQ